MSPDDTTALIRRYLDAFNAKDSDGMLDCLTDDVAHDINQGRARDRQGEIPLVQRQDEPAL